MNHPKTRCPWPGTDILMLTYHDTEWGYPLHLEQKHFEFLLLEFFQAGLSWSIILKKRENFRKAFDDFDVQKIARYKERKINSLMQDAGIIRNKLKILAAVNNARQFVFIQEEWGSFDKYIWSFTGGKPVVNHWTSISQVPVSTKLSDKVSKDMKHRGFKFVGTTTIYAHLQAIGIVNDHLRSCFRHTECQV